MIAHLLIVDDEESVRESFRLALQEKYQITFAGDAKSALKALKLREYDLCLLDILLPDGSGLDLLKQVKRRDETLDVIMITALQGVDTALEAMKQGAYDYLTKPYKLEDLYSVIHRALVKRDLERENRYLREEQQNYKPLVFIGSSVILRELRKNVERIAQGDSPVLLTGETGSGQGEIAREIHRLSPRSHSPFVRLDCSKVARGHWESELFGWEGDDRNRKTPQIGKLEFAHGGTLFLDQVASMPAQIQNKLVKTLEKKSFCRLDGKTAQSMDARVIASLEGGQVNSARDLSLQQELFLLLKDFSLAVPSLRERKADLAELIHWYLRKANNRTGMPVKAIHKDAVQLLVKYPWPGNLREMEAVLEMMVLFAGKENLGLEDIPLDLLVKQIDLEPIQEEAKVSLKRIRNQFERQYIRKVLERTRGNQTRAASALGLHRNTLIWKLRELNLEGEYKQIVKQRRDRGIGFKDL